MKPVRLYKPALADFKPVVGLRALVDAIDFPKNPQPHLVLTSRIVAVLEEGAFETENSIYRLSGDLK